MSCFARPMFVPVQPTDAGQVAKGVLLRTSPTSIARNARLVSNHRRWSSFATFVASSMGFCMQGARTSRERRRDVIARHAQKPRRQVKRPKRPG
eukprot:3392700-Amphidinium_carterae.1